MKYEYIYIYIYIYQYVFYSLFSCGLFSQTMRISICIFTVCSPVVSFPKQYSLFVNFVYSILLVLHEDNGSCVLIWFCCTLFAWIHDYLILFVLPVDATVSFCQSFIHSPVAGFTFLTVCMYDRSTSCYCLYRHRCRRHLWWFLYCTLSPVLSLDIKWDLQQIASAVTCLMWPASVATVHAFRVQICSKDECL